MNMYACAARAELKITEAFVSSCWISVQSLISGRATNLCKLELPEPFPFPLLCCISEGIGVVEQAEQYFEYSARQEGLKGCSTVKVK